MPDRYGARALLVSELRASDVSTQVAESVGFRGGTVGQCRKMLQRRTSGRIHSNAADEQLTPVKHYESRRPTSWSILKEVAVSEAH
jgi:hypothetical protein